MTTFGEVTHALSEARETAYQQADDYFRTKLGGVDRFACGFSWVEIHKHNDKPVNGRSRIGKLLKQAGLTQNHNRKFYIWNPSGLMCQNIDTLNVGAEAAVDTLRKYGFESYACSRLD